MVEGSVPLSTLREACAITTLPLLEVKTGTSETFAEGPSSGPQGIHTLYDAPRSVGLKWLLNCSGVNANFRSGSSTPPFDLRCETFCLRPLSS
jgi:hypothetical protein